MRLAPPGWSWSDFADVLALIVCTFGLVVGVMVTR